MSNFNYAPFIAIAQILFGAVGITTGWINASDSLTIIMLGLSVFGVHNSNVKLGRALGSRS